MNFGFETETIEFKESLSQLSRGLESIVAMLNKHGKGTLYFGVKDNGDVCGVSLGNKSIKDLSDAIINRIKPLIVPTIALEVHNFLTVIKVDFVGNNKPYSADGNYLIRSGNENKKIAPEIMRDLLFTNSLEVMTEIESFNQELTFNQLKQLYIMSNYTIKNDTFEKNLVLINRNSKYNLLANILSDNNDCSIKVVRFNGVDKSEMIYRNEYGYKCLILSLQSALDYVLSLNETKVVVNENAVRKEIQLFNSKCLREAWSNACLHTRWDKMIPPAIYIFNDRIEVVSTGGLPIDYSLEDFYNGISHPINRQLQKIMGQLGIVEQTGHGVAEIIKIYGKEAFTITDNNVIVTLKFPFNISSNSFDFSNLTSSQKTIINAFINNPTITKNELSAVSGLSVSRVSIILKELKELNKIERVGSNKNGYWKIL